MSDQLYTKQQITDNQINHSSAKQMYSFSKAERFPPLKRIGYSDNFYVLPPLKHPRGASFGYGKKYDFTQSPNRCNQPAFYSGKRDYDPDSPVGPSYTFGIAREKYEKVYYKTNKTIDRNVPGAGKYLPKIQCTEPPKYTMGVRYSQQKTRNAGSPGPGSYPSVLQISADGKYPSSKYRNITAMSFGSPNAQRFNYKIKGDTSSLLGGDVGWGKHFNSRYKSSHDVVILGRPKDKDMKAQFPGPGAYNVFSEFSMYGPKAIKTEPTRRKKKEEDEIHEEDESRVDNEARGEDETKEEEQQPKKEEEPKKEDTNDKPQEQEQKKEEENKPQEQEQKQEEEKNNDNNNQQGDEVKKEENANNTNEQKEEQPQEYQDDDGNNNNNNNPETNAEPSPETDVKPNEPAEQQFEEKEEQ